MNSFIITNGGYSLYAKALTGKSLEFTRLCIGSGKEDGSTPSKQDIKSLTALYTQKFELADINVENGALVCIDVTEPVFELEELPGVTDGYEDGAYIYVTSSNKLYEANGNVWEEKTVNSGLSNADEFLYDTVSGKLKYYTVDESVVLIKAAGSNELLTSGFYEKELGLFARTEDSEEVLFAYAYESGNNTNFLTPATEGVINLEYFVALSVSQNESLEIINAGSSSVSPAAFNILSETVNKHIESTKAIHEGLKNGFGVDDLTSFSAGSIVIEKNNNDIPASSGKENIKAKDTLAVIIGKLKRVIFDFYNHKHKVSDIENINSVLTKSVIIGEYIGNGLATRKFELDFTPRMVEIYCVNFDYMADYNGVATQGVNSISHPNANDYIKKYNSEYCKVSICDKGFLVSQTTQSATYVDRARTNQLNVPYIYKVTR